MIAKMFVEDNHPKADVKLFESFPWLCFISKCFSSNSDEGYQLNRRRTTVVDKNASKEA